MTNGEKMQVDFPDIKMWGESKDTLDYSLGGMIHRVTKSWWDAEYKEPVIRYNGVKDELEPTNKTCRTCKNFGSHHGICEICKDNKCWTEKEPTKNNLAVDCISRADVNQVIEDYMDEQYHVLSDRTRERAFGAKVVMARINELPSVTTIRPKGHWIKVGDKGFGYSDIVICKCSECEYQTGFVGKFDGHNLVIDAERADNCCSNCGADMRSNTVRKGKPIEGNNESYNCENWIP